MLLVLLDLAEEYRYLLSFNFTNRGTWSILCLLFISSTGEYLKLIIYKLVDFIFKNKKNYLQEHIWI